MNHIRFLTAVVCLLACMHYATARHQVTSLPLYTGPALPTMYTGYVTVDGKAQHSLFYWLIEAESSPSTAPLVVWFQGGPGGSSVFGLLYENGPVSVADHATKLQKRPETWIQFANVLWVEQPIGVGFSYSNDTADYSTLNDTVAAADSLQFLRSWITTEFPEYHGRDTWLTGESYAGVYLPTLGAQLAKDDLIGSQFRGIMNGNPCFACAPEAQFGSTYQQFSLLYWHGLVSQELFDEFDANGCNAPQRGKVASATCKGLLATAFKTVGTDFSGDDLYSDPCTDNATLALVDSVQPCDPYLVQMVAYMNRPDVQEALGVRNRPVLWNGGPSVSGWNYVRNTGSMIPYYESIFATKKSRGEEFSLLIYSGDVDVATVPFAFTMPCLTEFKGTRTEPWQPWTLNGHTAGYWEQFTTHTYVTIKGGGHETPAFVPLQALEVFKRFLLNQTMAVSGGGEQQRRLHGGRPGIVRQSQLLRRVAQPQL